VADESPFDVAQAFTPFDEQEMRRIRRYANRVKRLRECKLWEQLPALTVKGSTIEGQARADITHAGTEADRSHFLMMFRPLYMKTEVNGFLQVAAMMREHAEKKGGPDAATAVEMIAEYEQGHHQELRSSVLEIREAGGNYVVPPERLFKTWLSGHDFHEDEAKTDILDRLALPGVYEWVYLHMAVSLAAIYCRFGTFANAILREPSLLP
jgi:hypothetical protein